jgi:WD40 repeat protein
VLDEALRAPTSERGLLLDRLCGDNTALRQEVASLMGHLPDPENPDNPTAPWQEPSLEGQVIGGCRIETLLGRGGTGRVYRAMQEWPPRAVAVKVLRPELLSESSRRRFRRETRALARLDHPAIARIHSAGVRHDQAADLPFLIMELVEGGRNITQWWRDASRPLAQKLELFATVCDGVHHGHVRGLVHRDIKPSNVLVGVDGQPKVIDFGVASMTDDEGLPVTVTRAIAGTPGYMAPEQFEGPRSIDLRTDVHGLGLLLHECLTGRPVYAREGLNLPAAARLLASETAPLVGSTHPQYRGDLETIVAHALERNPANRYQSASEMAADIRRHLQGHPILARPTPAMDRVRLMVRRNPWAAAGFAAAIVSVSLGLAPSIAFGLRERVSAARAEAALAQSERALWLSRLAEFARTIETRDAAGIRVANLSLGKDDRWPVRLLRTLGDESVALTGKTDLDQHHAWMGGAVSPDGAFVAAVSDAANGVWLLDAKDLSLIRNLSPGVGAWAVAFDPIQGRLLVAQGRTLHVWNMPWQDPPRRIPLPFDYGTGIAPSPDGTRVALASEGNCCVVELDTGNVLARTDTVSGSTTRLAWSPDGSTIAIGVEPESIRLLDAVDLSEVRSIRSFPRRTLAIDFDPTGRWLAFGGDLRKLRVVDVANPDNVREIALDHSIWGLRWHPDGTRIAIGDRGAGVRLVEVPPDGGPIRRAGDFCGHQAEVWWVEWNRAGDRLYSFGQAETHAWRDRPRNGPPFFELGAPGLALGRLANGSIAALAADGSVWEVPDAWNAEPLRVHTGSALAATAAAISASGERWAWIDPSGRITVVQATDGSERTIQSESFVEPATFMAFSPSARRLAVSGRNAKDPLLIVDISSGAIVGRVQGLWNQRPTSLMWISEDEIIAGDYSTARVVMREPDGTWRARQTLTGPWTGARLTRSDTALTGSFSGEIIERSVRSDDRVRVFPGLTDMGLGSAISDDDTLLAAVGTDRRLHVFDRATGEQLISVLGHPPGRMVHAVEFSPSNSHVVTLDVGGGLAIWDTRGPRNAAGALNHANQ